MPWPCLRCMPRPEAAQRPELKTLRRVFALYKHQAQPSILQTCQAVPLMHLSCWLRAPCAFAAKRSSSKRYGAQHLAVSGFLCRLPWLSHAAMPEQLWSQHHHFNSGTRSSWATRASIFVAADASCALHHYFECACTRAHCKSSILNTEFFVRFGFLAAFVHCMFA